MARRPPSSSASRFFAIAALGALILPGASLSRLEAQWGPEGGEVSRPDDHAGAGMRGVYLPRNGEFILSYRVLGAASEGLRLGKDAVSPIVAAEEWGAVPLRMSSVAHDLELLFSPYPRVAVFLSGQWIDRSLEESTASDPEREISASGLGDVRFGAMVEAYRSANWRAHLSLGVSAPTGAIDEKGVRSGTGAQLPYLLQPGSGSFDLLPSATLRTRNDFGTVGLRVGGTIRTALNERDWRLGHGAEVEGWAAHRLGDQISVSWGVAAEVQGAISGRDAALDPSFSPLDSVESWGGVFVEVPVGFRFAPATGLLRGQELSVEGRWPVSQDTDGLQLKRRPAITARWQGALDLF